MKQHLGLEYSLNNPHSYLISNRLAELQASYGGISLLGSILRLQRKGYKIETNPVVNCDIHVMNLFCTYSKKSVVEMYNLIYSLNSKVG